MLKSVFFLLLFVVLNFSSVIYANSYSSRINRAKSFFDYGRFNETIKILDDVLKDTSKLNSISLLNSYQLIARSYYYQKNLEYAEHYLKLLFLFRSDYMFDPVDVDPKFIDFANMVYKKYKKEIIKNQNDIAILLRKKNPEKYDEVTVNRHLYKNFIPFGVGQFQNGHKYKAYMIIGIESLSFITSVTSFFILKHYQHDDYTFDNTSLAQTGKVINNVAFFVFLGTYIYATIDGILYFYAASDINVIQSSNFEFLPVVTDDLKYVKFSFRF